MPVVNGIDAVRDELASILVQLTCTLQCRVGVATQSQQAFGSVQLEAVPPKLCTAWLHKQEQAAGLYELVRARIWLGVFYPRFG